MSLYASIKEKVVNMVSGKKLGRMLVTEEIHKQRGDEVG